MEQPEPQKRQREDSGEILVIPFYDMGHIFPATELSLRLAVRGLHITLFLPSSVDIPPLHPRIKIVRSSRPPPHARTDAFIKDYILSPSNSFSFAVVDTMMGNLFDSLLNRGVPFAVLFTSSACSTSLDDAAHSFLRPDRVGSATAAISGFPDEMGITQAYFLRRPRNASAPPAPPPRVALGRGVRDGLAAVDGASALAFNTCDELERPFLEYVTAKTGKKAWGVGPLIPAGFPSSGETENGEGAMLMTWLDAQPSRSVLYVCFGSRVEPTEWEKRELAAALGESKRCRFVWALRDPEGKGWLEELERIAKGRGVVVRGWAPQRAILSHGATGGFLTHCGWNSTVEAVGCGVPMLTWPLEGDQIHNERLVTRWLRVGKELKAGEAWEVTREGLMRGIEVLMGDEELRLRAEELRVGLGFKVGIPSSSEGAMNDLCNLLEGGGKGPSVKLVGESWGY